MAVIILENFLSCILLHSLPATESLEARKKLQDTIHMDTEEFLCSPFVLGV